MPSKYTEIELAITNSFNTTLNGIPTEWPNFLLTTKPDNLWAAVHNLRGDSLPATIGIDGEDNHPGIIQIDLNYPINRGTSVIMDKIDEIVSLYPAGTDLTYNGQSVRIVASSVSPGRTVGGYYRVSISLTYYSRTLRN